jgi:hypothetical protein
MSRERSGSVCRVLDRMSIRWNESLPTELWLVVFSLLGADATPKDWISVELVCKMWRAARTVWFAEWLSAQPLGSRFCRFIGNRDTFTFVGEHIAGREVPLGCVGVLSLTSWQSYSRRRSV